MLHAESKSRCLESQDGSAVEPCSKKMKSTEEPYGKSYDGLQSLYEEVHVKKTHSGFIPLSLFDDEDGVDETTRGLVPSKEVFLGIKPVTCKPSNAVNNTEITGNKYAFSGKNTAVVNNRENNESLEKYKNEGNTELYSTSKAFIGPIYKIEVVQQTKGKKSYNYRNHQKVPKAMRGGSSKKEMAPKRSLPSDIPKIEDELSQFYSEIHQLESDENILDKAGKDFHKQPVEYNKWNQIECISSQDLSYSKTTSSCDGGQCFYGEPSDRRICSEQNPYNGQMGHRTGNGQSFGSERNAWEAEKPCNKQAGSRFWNDSVPPFNPGWQQTPPFIIPYGPPPPQFIRNFNFQEPVPSSHHSNNFSSSNVGPFENTHINMSCSPSDKNSDRTSHSGTPSIQTIQNGYSVQERYIGNGFYETATCWKDAQQTEGSSSVSEQFLEGSLCESQKQLLILRGLPGSGKTTLSRILLGHSHDGIVFSTDDYFCQQDGWSYDVGQLGAAHDWNQKRAKQAMDQGRSPIIIDNTNTQAWEMKPYVEAALEKCYRVEFHEPDTWWKFNPEELEKKNKHGVSREKIIQMLERYEYQISIPVVMNSVLPFHKTSQRPPPQRRQRETVVKKKHKLHKMKQRRKRKRNRKMKGAAVKIVEKKSDPQTPSDDWSQSGEEDSEDNRKSASIDESLKELIADGEVDSANESSLKCSELQKGSFCVSGMVDPITSDKSLQIDVLSSNQCPSSTSLPFVPNKNITELLSSDYLPDGIQNENLVETKNSILEYKNQSSPPKSDCTNAENSPVLSSTEDKAVHTKTISELGPGNKLLGNKKEVSVFHQHETSRETKRNTWAFFSFDSVDEQPHASSDKNEPCLTWPECSSNVIYEQRPRKARKPKQVFSERTTKLSDKKSNKELEKGGDGAVLNEGDNRIDCSVRSLLSEMPGTETSNFPIEASNFPTESVTKDSVPTGVALIALPTGKGRCRRIFNLAPNFDLPRQILVRKDEKVLRDADVLIEQEKVSDDNIRGEDKQSLGCHGSPVHSSYAVAVDSLCPDAESLVCNLVPTKLTESMDSSKKVAASPLQICTSASLAKDGQVITPNKTVEIHTDRKRERMPRDISTTQPDILYSVKATTECLTKPVAEQCKKMHQINKLGATKCSSIEDDQGLLSTKSSFLKLPLSLGFALQLVKLFGSPAVPLDTLLPDDYVVPLDWTISKEIYLRWKASVEKNQKKNQSKGYDALPAGGAALEDSKEVDGQEKQESSDANPQMHLFQ